MLLNNKTTCAHIHTFHVMSEQWGLPQVTVTLWEHPLHISAMFDVALCIMHIATFMHLCGVH